jgi:hypothetical protein
MNTTPNITRRRAMKTMTAALAAGLTRAEAAAAAPAEPTLHAYPEYGWLRGFSMVPSWGARIEDAWWFYDGAKMREEAALARQVHANCIRLWIEFTAWFRDPDGVTARFLDAVAAIAETGMRAMPCLFNRWHDSKFDYGGTYVENLRPNGPEPLEYVRALVAPLANDPRVLCWDLCNEPQAKARKGFTDELCRREFDWLAAIARTVRDCGARQPILIGTMWGENIAFYSPLVDVLCAHPYARDRNGLESAIASYREIAAKEGKPLLVNESIPGCLDDATRATGAKYYTELLSKAGFGWMGWALREGIAISTRRDRIDGNGFHGDGFHPFFTKEGRLRPGLEFLTERPDRLAPWEKA